jgi:DNA-binding response OmpR family regulator
MLRDLLHANQAPHQPKIKWLLDVAVTLEAAVAALQKHSVALVVCESSLLPGTWKDLMEHVSAHPQPPLMIVTSRLADEYLWAEALHYGAYDVLRKPFDPDELTRVLIMASLKWSHRHKRR